MSVSGRGLAPPSSRAMPHRGLYSIFFAICCLCFSSLTPTQILGKKKRGKNSRSAPAKKRSLVIDENATGQEEIVVGQKSADETVMTASDPTLMKTPSTTRRVLQMNQNSESATGGAASSDAFRTTRYYDKHAEKAVLEGAGQADAKSAEEEQAFMEKLDEGPPPPRRVHFADAEGDAVAEVKTYNVPTAEEQEEINKSIADQIKAIDEQDTPFRQEEREEKEAQRKRVRESIQRRKKEREDRVAEARARTCCGWLLPECFLNVRRDKENELSFDPLSSFIADSSFLQNKQLRSTSSARASMTDHIEQQVLPFESTDSGSASAITPGETNADTQCDLPADPKVREELCRTLCTNAEDHDRNRGPETVGNADAPQQMN